MKALGGLLSQQSLFHQLLSNDYPTSSVLAESYNDFLVGLTAHFEQLVSFKVSYDLETPSQLLIGESEDYSALHQLKTSKSPGPDGIPNKLLKIFALELVEGTFPQILKRSFVIPIPKTSRPKSIEEDLRPISLTAQIGKLMEGFNAILYVSVLSVKCVTMYFE